MKILVTTLCYNEQDIIPFVVDYWQEMIRQGIDLKVIVYDNQSSDNSVSLLKEHPFIEVMEYASDGCDDILLMSIKNNAWKDTDADWVIACDMDEIVYSPNIIECLEKNTCDVIWPRWYICASMEYPKYNGELLHSICPRWTKYNRGNKALIFNPRTIKDMNYGIGCHSCNPTRYDGIKPTESVEDMDIYCLHIDKRLSEDYFVRQMKERNERRSERNRKYGWGSHYAKSEQEHRKEYREIVKKAVDIRYIINNNGEA